MRKKEEKKTRGKIKWKVLILSLVIVYFVAFIGSLFTSNTDSEWYNQIRPKITPPNWVFPIVWNILFFLIALSLYFSWINSKSDMKKSIAIVFGINFILNILWSVFYFYLKNPLLAFYELIFLWISILFMIYVAGRINKKAGWILVPYFLWVSFAGILNYLSI